MTAQHSEDPVLMYLKEAVIPVLKDLREDVKGLRDNLDICGKDIVRHEEQIKNHGEDIRGLWSKVREHVNKHWAWAGATLVVLGLFSFFVNLWAPSRHGAGVQDNSVVKAAGK